MMYMMLAIFKQNKNAKIQKFKISFFYNSFSLLINSRAFIKSCKLHLSFFTTKKLQLFFWKTIYPPISYLPDI